MKIMPKKKKEKEEKRLPTDEEIQFGMRLAKLRAKRNLTQTKATEEMNKLAKEKKLAEIGTNTLRTYEAGRFPRIDKLKTIKTYYDVSYDHLFGVIEDENYDMTIQKNQKAINDIKKILIDLQKQN